VAGIPVFDFSVVADKDDQFVAAVNECSLKMLKQKIFIYENY